MTAKGVYSKVQRQDLERLMCRVARNVHWTGLEQALEYAVRAIHVRQVGLSRAWLHLWQRE